MTDVASAATCVLCGKKGSVTMDPPRRTVARGPDSEDPSLSVIAVLPDVVLCTEHAEDYAQKQIVIGWCDDKAMPRLRRVRPEIPLRRVVRSPQPIVGFRFQTGERAHQCTRDICQKR